MTSACRQRGFHVAANHAAAHQHVAGAILMHERSLVGQCGVDCGVRRKLGPSDRKLGQIERVHRGRFAHDCGNCLAAEAGFVLGENRLIGERRDDAKTVLAGHVFGGENTNDAGMGRDKGVEVAEFKERAMVGAANHASNQSLGRP